MAAVLGSYRIYTLQNSDLPNEWKTADLAVTMLINLVIFGVVSGLPTGLIQRARS